MSDSVVGRGAVEAAIGPAAARPVPQVREVIGIKRRITGRFRGVAPGTGQRAPERPSPPASRSGRRRGRETPRPTEGYRTGTGRFGRPEHIEARRLEDGRSAGHPDFGGDRRRGPAAALAPATCDPAVEWRTALKSRSLDGRRGPADGIASMERHGDHGTPIPGCGVPWADMALHGAPGLTANAAGERPAGDRITAEAPPLRLRISPNVA
jgi:hypothetical protein